MAECRICPRRCGVDRKEKRGYCGEGEEIRIARAALHYFEEPCISGDGGKGGSGTVFFSGCNLRCVYCQNSKVSRGELGEKVSGERLGEIILRLESEGANNINLVTPTHFVPQIAEVLRRIKPFLRIPVVYNSGGYDSPGGLAMLDGLVDVYMPDFKYYSAELSAKYSGAADYAEVASEAMREMFRQVGSATFDSCGLIKKGMIVRHLVLPGCRKDSLAVLDRLAGILPVGEIKLSLMSQYTPSFAGECGFENLKRRITAFEYDSVLEHAISLGFDGYFQERSSATEAYTPDFEAGLSGR